MKYKELYYKLKIKVRRLMHMNIDPNELAESQRSSFYYLGKNVKLYNPSLGPERYLISLHNNVTCANNVTFLCHDVSCKNIARYLGVDEKLLTKIGKIEIRENAFIGANSIIMPGCVIGKNSIIAAGSVVTKSVPDGEVWGGGPAKHIMTTKDYANKLVLLNRDYPWVSIKGNIKASEDIIKLKQSFFYKNQ